MARLLLSLAALAALAPFTHAGIIFTKPEAGAVLTAGTAIEVEWKEGGDGPALADLLSYQLFLSAGGPTKQMDLLPITTVGSFLVSNAASAMVGTAVGENTPENAYFIKMMAVGKTGGILTTYSDRFSYSGMVKGVFSAEIKPDLANIKGTDGPATVDQTVKAGAPNPADPAVGDYGVAYTMQTGLTRYAPMQPVPPTKVTAKNPKPMYPTSSVVIAKTRLPIPTQQTTLTQSQTFSVQSRANTAAPAPMPSDDMAKFLNRWKD